MVSDFRLAGLSSDLNPGRKPTNTASICSARMATFERRLPEDDMFAKSKHPASPVQRLLVDGCQY